MLRYYYDQKQASSQPPGLQQRQMREAMVSSRCRRVRVQSVWDFMTNRWSLLPKLRQKSDGVHAALRPGGRNDPSSMIGYDVIHASLLSSSLQTRCDPLLPLSKSFPCNPSSTRPSAHRTCSSTSSSTTGVDDNDAKTPHAPSSSLTSTTSTKTPLGLLGRLHEKLRLEMTRSQSVSRATSSTLDAFDVLHARARRCSAAHLQENSENDINGDANTTLDNGVKSEAKREGRNEQAKEDNESSNFQGQQQQQQQQQPQQVYPGLHASLFQSNTSTTSSSWDLLLPTGQSHPPDTSGLLHLDHLSKPHTSLNPQYPFPEPTNNALAPSSAETTPSFSGLEVASSFFSMNHPVDSALTLVGAPG